MLQSRLKKIMKETKTTQQILSAKTNIGQSSISEYLNGKNEPSASKLLIIATYFDVSIDWILGRTENMHSHKS